MNVTSKLLPGLFTCKEKSCTKMNKEPYFCDFMMSIGPHCRPAINMRYNNRRDLSSPLDWMMDYSLETVIHLFRCEFDDFFEQILEDDSKAGTANGMRWVTDKKNGIISIHHFPLETSLEQALPIFYQKMNYRFKRLNNCLKCAQKVVLVTARNESVEEINEFINDFSQIYGSIHGRLINIRNNEQLGFNEIISKSVETNNRIDYIDYSINDTNKGVFDPNGNTSVWSRILFEYDTKHSRECRDKLMDFWRKKEKPLIFGAGKRSQRIMDYLSNTGLEIGGFAVTSMSDNPYSVHGVDVKPYFDYPKDSTFIIGVESPAEQKKYQICFAKIIIEMYLCLIRIWNYARVEIKRA